SPARAPPVRETPMSDPGSFQRIVSISRKEMLHIFRDRQTLFMTLFFPVVELLMLGYAIDTNVRHIKTVLLNQDRSQSTDELVRRFTNTTDFDIVKVVYSEREVYEAIVRGDARVGIKIPEHYSRRLQDPRRLAEGDQPAQIQILVDGTVSSVA